MTEQEQQRRRFVLPGWRMLAIGAAVAGTGVIALVALHQPAPSASRFAVSMGEDNTRAQASTDPLVAELLRCRSLAAGTDDAACQKAWEVNRRRFMGESGSYVPSVSGTLTEGQ